MSGAAVRSLAVYTTLYPGVEPFLRDWCRSLLGQTDRGFTLWVGLDALSVQEATAALGCDLRATWLPAAPGDSPAQVRQRALERLVTECDAVVLVDSDDILHPSRVAGARELLRGCDLAGCALRLVDRRGGELGLSLGGSCGGDPARFLPRTNVFGLSNSAFRCETLARCLPIPATAELVDWYLATRAWLAGALLAFDPVPRMDYRQHGANMVRVRPPFDPRQVAADCGRVRHHLDLVATHLPEGARPERVAALHGVAAEVERFHREVVLDEGRLERYVEAINRLDEPPVWWWSVAHPRWREIWHTEEKP